MWNHLLPWVHVYLFLWFSLKKSILFLFIWHSNLWIQKKNMYKHINTYTSWKIQIYLLMVKCVVYLIHVWFIWSMCGLSDPCVVYLIHVWFIWSMCGLSDPLLLQKLVHHKYYWLHSLPSSLCYNVCLILWNMT